MYKIVENFKRWAKRGFKPYESGMNIRLAPIKKIYRIDCGKISQSEVDAYMTSVIEKIKSSPPFIDPKTGEYNLKYNYSGSMDMNQDFYM